MGKGRARGVTEGLGKCHAGLRVTIWKWSLIIKNGFGGRRGEKEIFGNSLGKSEFFYQPIEIVTSYYKEYSSFFIAPTSTYIIAIMIIFHLNHLKIYHNQLSIYNTTEATIA